MTRCGFHDVLCTRNHMIPMSSKPGKSTDQLNALSYFVLSIELRQKTAQLPRKTQSDAMEATNDVTEDTFFAAWQSISLSKLINSGAVAAMKRLLMRCTALLLLCAASVLLRCAVCSADEEVLGEIFRDIEAEQREMRETAQVLLFMCYSCVIHVLFMCYSCVVYVGFRRCCLMSEERRRRRKQRRRAPELRGSKRRTTQARHIDTLSETRSRLPRI